MMVSHVFLNIYLEFTTIGPIIRSVLKDMGYKFDKVHFLKEIKVNKVIYQELNNFIIRYAKNREK